jgi:hypothetical protein
MIALTLTQKIAWATNPLILFTCAYFLSRRTDFKYFRGFLLYMLLVGGKSCAMYFVYGHWGYSSSTSSYISYALTLMCIGISFYVLYEVLRNVLTSGTVDLSGSNVLLIAFVLLVIAAVLSLTFQAKQDSLLLKIEMMAENLARFQQLGLLLTLAILTLFFGLYWGELAFGIAAGFGFYASMQVINMYVRGYFGPVMIHLFNVADVWSYQAASLIWLFYILKKPKLPSKALPSDKVSEYTEPIERMIR